MSNTTNKQSAAEKVREALATNPDSTAAELVTISGLGRSTVNKELATLKQSGDATAVKGDGDSRARTPARWSLGGQAEHVRLRPGELGPLVFEHVRSLDEPVGPTAVAKALGRSNGAVANCMTRLAESGTLGLVNEKPRRYEIK